MNKIKNKKVVGIILAYKHATFLEGLIEKIPKDLLDDIFITNDESGDGIEKIAERLGVKCFSHPRLGYGGNMKYGMAKAIELGADYIVEIHGDDQYDLSFIEPAIEKMDEKCGLVLGSRFVDILQPLRDSMPLIKYLANIFLTFTERIALRVKVSEFHTGARLYSRKALESIDMSGTSNNFVFSFEIITQIIYAGFDVREVPVRCYYAEDHSSISLKNSILYALESYKVLFYFICAKVGFENHLFKNINE